MFQEWSEKESNYLTALEEKNAELTEEKTNNSRLEKDLSETKLISHKMSLENESLRQRYEDEKERHHSLIKSINLERDQSFKNVTERHKQSLRSLEDDFKTKTAFLEKTVEELEAQLEKANEMNRKLRDNFEADKLLSKQEKETYTRAWHEEKVGFYIIP